MRVTGRLALNIIRSHRQAHTPKGHANPTPPPPRRALHMLSFQLPCSFTS